MASIRVEDTSTTGFMIADADNWYALEYDVPMYLSEPAVVDLADLNDYPRFVTAVMVDDAWKAADLSSIDATTTSGKILRVWRGDNLSHKNEFGFKLLPLKETLGEKITSLAFSFMEGDNSSMHVKLFGFEEMSDEAMIGFRATAEETVEEETNGGAKLMNWKGGLEVSNKCWLRSEWEGGKGIFGSIPMATMSFNVPILADQRYYDKTSLLLPNTKLNYSELHTGVECSRGSALTGQCDISIHMTDWYSDNWSGGSVSFYDSDGVHLGNHGMENWASHRLQCLSRLQACSCYTAKTNGGQFPQDIEWAVSSSKGVIVEGDGHSGDIEFCVPCEGEEGELMDFDIAALYEEPMTIKAQMSMKGLNPSVGSSEGLCDMSRMRLWWKEGECGNSVKGDCEFTFADDYADLDIELVTCDYSKSFDGTEVYVDGDYKMTVGEGVGFFIPLMLKLASVDSDNVASLTYDIYEIPGRWERPLSPAWDAPVGADKWAEEGCLDAGGEVQCEDTESCFGMSCDDVVGIFGSDVEGLHAYWLENEAGCNCESCQVVETDYHDCSPTSVVMEEETATCWTDKDCEQGQRCDLKTAGGRRRLFGDMGGGGKCVRGQRKRKA